MTVVFVSCIGVVVGSLLQTAIGHRRITVHAYQREQAFTIAEAGFESLCQIIVEKGQLMPATFRTNGVLGGGQFTGTATRTAPNRYQVAATGVLNGLRWTVAAQSVETPTWAQYALWMKQNGYLYFIGGERYDGHVHSDSLLYFTDVAGDGADFYDQVTSSELSFGGTTNGATFACGLELGSAQDTMAAVDFALLNEGAEMYGLVVTGATAITFAGSSMEVSNEARGWTNHPVALGTNDILYVKSAPPITKIAIADPSDPSQSITAVVPEEVTIDDPGRVYVRGKVEGRITIAADEDIYITDHLAYSDDPRTNASVADALGLIAKDDVWVDTSAPDNLRVDAAIMAVGQLPSDDGTFGVIHFDQGVPRGDLDVFGGIVQEVRGAVGTFDANGPLTGFRKKYGYDGRFRENAPPFYPRLGSKLRIVGWRERSG